LLCRRFPGAPSLVQHESVSDRLEKQDVARAVEYLELRGLLKRHPSNADLVRCVGKAFSPVRYISRTTSQEITRK
jgi:hypothetical protein